MREGGGLVTSAIESLLRSGTLVGLSEQELLERFVRQGDRRAFEAIVARHGPLVLAVCQQILADANDAEDAFQATFLVLIRRASRYGGREAWRRGFMELRTASPCGSSEATGLVGCFTTRPAGRPPALLRSEKTLPPFIRRSTAYPRSTGCPSFSVTSKG